MEEQQYDAVQAAAHTRAKGPNKYNVLILNDDTTPMDFVKQIIEVIFNKSSEVAATMVIEIHEKGRAIVGTYGYEIAEQKSLETITESRRSNYPLDSVLEEV
jgi:ATP-dependent Clp protease adaptor protein ClpS